MSRWMGLLLLTGCPFPQPLEGCTEIGCGPEGVNLEWELTEVGTWTIELDLVEGGQVVDSITCTATLPLDASACDHEDVVLLSSDPTLADATHQLTGLTVFATPQTVELRISLDGVERATESLQPVYETDYPNGEQCDAGCTYAFITVDLL